ncbi:MAG: endonuclease/exonuclease/phosphatase family protein [Bacteroidetes bacterium]|nr:endonuclease/exonuclease/phosphatase family protein [Bacteroidota bacterium]
MQKPFFRRFTKKLFILINLVLGLLFVTGTHMLLFNPEKWWYLSLITFLLPYLLLFLILFFVFWLFTKPVWSFISVFFIVISFQAIAHIFPLNFNSHFSIKKDSGSIRVMSWNVEEFNILNYKTHPEKKQQMFDLINAYDPDIACFQEAVAGESKKAINYLPDIIKSLHFTDYLYSYQLRDDFDKDHHFGIMIFSKYPIVAKQTIVNNPNNYNSTFQYVDLVIKGDTVRVFNIHLQSLKFSKENLNYINNEQTGRGVTVESKSVISKIKTGILKRAQQALFVKDEMNHSPYPLILCGDFNDVPESFAYETIGKGLKNAFVEKGSGLSRTFSSISPTLRIDNIFYDTDFQATQFIRVKKLLSDHFPIIADLKIVAPLKSHDTDSTF